MELPNHDITFRINTGTIIRFFLIALLIVALYFISDVVLVVLAAVIVASAAEPVIRRMKRYRVHRIITVILMYVIIAAVLAAVFIFFVPLVMSDTSSFLNSIPATISLSDIWNPITNNIGVDLGAASTSLASHNISVSAYLQGLQSLIVGTGAGAFRTASVLFGGALSFILIIVLSFYLAVKEEGVDDFLRIITPVKHHDYIIDLWKRSQRKIGLWLQGQIILGLMIGFLVYVVLLLVGIPHALVLALLAALLEIIPVFGPIIAAVPAILIAFTTNGIGTAALIAVLYIIIHQLESQVFYPLVVRKVVGISPIVVIIALIIGAKLAGVLGALIAVPLAAAFMEYIHDIEKYKKVEIAERATKK